VRLLVFGGTFDPVHRGHEAMADAARADLRPDLVLWVPAGRSPHKPDRVTASAEARTAFLQRVLATRPGEELCHLELERPGPSYTVDTLRVLATQHHGAEIFLLLGSDCLEHLATWRDLPALIGLAEFVFAPRRGWPRRAWQEFRDRLDPGLATRFRTRFLAMPEVAARSTEIRAALAQGAEPQHLRPAVLAEIRRRGCYPPSGGYPPTTS
jgi:nicotinate-nucleotide adenylyltransferase